MKDYIYRFLIKLKLKISNTISGNLESSSVASKGNFSKDNKKNKYIKIR